MRKATNLPIDKKRFKEVLDRMGLRQVDVDKILGLKCLTITKVMHYGNANQRIIEALEKKLGIKYDDICPIVNGISLTTDDIKLDASIVSASKIMEEINADTVGSSVENKKPRNLVSVQVDADVLAEAVKEGMKQFWQECKNDILKELEDAIFTGNYDAKRKYTSQDLTYDLHKCWTTDKGYAELPEVQATLHRKR